MACIKKFTMGSIPNLLRHINRTIENPSNQDIDPERISENYSLLPQREISDYDFFLNRKSEVYCYNRQDVKVAAGWIVTAPADLAPEQEDLFFQTTSDFLIERYGEKNTICSVVHGDEGGRKHLHYVFIPVVEDTKRDCEKICAVEVITPSELRCFHPALQKCLDDAGVDCHVMTGITREIGGSISVEDLKKAEMLIDRKRGFTW